MPQSDPSRTEKATPKRRDKARGEGNVPKSQELGKTFIVLMGLIALKVLIGDMGNVITDTFRWFFTESFHIDATPEYAYSLLVMSMTIVAKTVLPLLLILGFTAYLVMRLQVGKLWQTKSMKPKFSKIFNLMAGLKRMFASQQTFVRLGKSLLQAAAIAVAPYIVLRGEMEKLPSLFYMDVMSLLVYMLTIAAKMTTYALVPMLIIALADLIYTRWEYEEQLKMTKDEVKDERKQAEGDPRIKRAQRQKMMAVMMQRMLQQVPKADVVITNPTHLAIAIQYDPLEAPAPMVLAKGANKVAERIKDLAREHGIPIRENKPLAQALYKVCEIGEMIPEDLYQAVAAILAQLFKFKNRGRSAKA